MLRIGGHFETPTLIFGSPFEGMYTYLNIHYKSSNETTAENFSRNHRG